MDDSRNDCSVPGKALRPLPRNVLVPYDGTKASVRVVTHAAGFARRLGGKLHVLRVVSDRHVLRVAEEVEGGDLEAARAFCRRRVEAAFERLRAEAGLDGEGELDVVFAESVSQGIEEEVASRKIDLVVLRPGRRRDSARRDLGARLSERLGIDFLFVKGFTPPSGSSGVVVVPVDARSDTLGCVMRGIELCRAIGGEVRLVHVTSPDRAEPPAAARRNLADAEAIAAEAGVHATQQVRTAPTRVVGIIASAIVQAADLIVVRRSRSTIWGSVADRVNRQSCHDVYLVGECAGE
jgi:nucleotide-binding universal stress UspA family protein